MTDTIIKIDKLDEIKQLILEAEAILITAGAGMGVDSGLPDFRGKDGFWKAYPIAKKLDIEFQDLANVKWFHSNPSFAWAFYGHRFNLYKNTIPHRGFNILLDFVKEKNDNYFVYTSNVDGQFQKAGFDENKIVECHGSISHTQCLNSCSQTISEISIDKFDIDMDDFLAANIPVCKSCGDTARPNILMFGDCYWNASKTIKQESRYSKWLKQNKSKKLLILEIGAGTAISTVRAESQNIAKYYNGKLIRINPRDFQADSAYAYSFPFGAIEGLERIIKLYEF